MSNDGEYEQLMTTLGQSIGIAQMMLSTITDEALDKALCTVQMADSVGAILDPTAYRRCIDTNSLERQKALIKMAKTLKAFKP